MIEITDFSSHIIKLEKKLTKLVATRPLRRDSFISVHSPPHPPLLRAFLFSHLHTVLCEHYQTHIVSQGFFFVFFSALRFEIKPALLTYIFIYDYSSTQ